MKSEASVSEKSDSEPFGSAKRLPQPSRKVASFFSIATAQVDWNYVNPEHVLSTELGIKSRYFGDSLELDAAVFDDGYAGGISYFPRASSLGVVLPSNSPGVHSLWAPAFAMKTPLVLKPGSAEPWTPYRIIQALIQSGGPPQVFGYYPADHAGGGEILRQCGRGMVFGDVSSTVPA